MRQGFLAILLIINISIKLIANTYAKIIICFEIPSTLSKFVRANILKARFTCLTYIGSLRNKMDEKQKIVLSCKILKQKQNLLLDVLIT